MQSWQARYARRRDCIPTACPFAWVGGFKGHRENAARSGADLMRGIILAMNSHTTRISSTRERRRGGRTCRKFRTVVSPRQKLSDYTRFSALTPHEERELDRAHQPLQAGHDLGRYRTPKQDKFMRRYLPQFDTHVMFGVGAAFDFHTGRIQDCSDGSACRLAVVPAPPGSRRLWWLPPHQSRLSLANRSAANGFACIHSQ